jgi:hypothetical protein
VDLVGPSGTVSDGVDDFSEVIVKRDRVWLSWMLSVDIQLAGRK